MLQVPTRQSAPPDFQIFTGALAAGLEGGRKIISCTASSSVVDLHGDEITADCVRSMADQALSKGMTIFLNHSYQIPEDTFGKTIFANSSKADDGIALLNLQIEVDETNPRANQTYASVMGDPAKGRKGLRLGVSIGAQITEWEWRDAKKEWDGGILIKGVDLLEASIVGIPANPRSWVQNAVKSLRGRNGDLVLNSANPPLDEDEDDDLDDDLTKPKSSPGTGEEMKGVEVPLDATATLTVKADGTGTVVIEAASCPDCGGSSQNPKGDCSNAMHKSEEPTLTVDEILERLGGEEAVDLTADSHPESPDTATPLAGPELTASADTTSDPVDSAPEGGDSRGDVEAVTDPAVETVVASAAEITVSDADRPVLTVVLATLEQVASELHATRSQLATVQTERDALIAERDKAVSDAAYASQIIEAIARLPLGRKARFVEPIQSFRQRFSGIYDEDFLRLIDERQDS